MTIKNFGDLYLDQLQDNRSSEKQITAALTKMIKAATHPKLKAAFTAHLAETKVQIERLDSILADLGKSAGRKVCEATVGLVKEGADLIESTEPGELRDAGLICAAQKVEHYEIACYGCLKAYAAAIGRDGDITLHDTTLNEEKHADESLTELALAVINQRAASESPAADQRDRA